MFQGLMMHTGDTYGIYSESDSHSSICYCLFLNVRVTQSRSWDQRVMGQSSFWNGVGDGSIWAEIELMWKLPHVNNWGGRSFPGRATSCKARVCLLHLRNGKWPQRRISKEAGLGATLTKVPPSPGTMVQIVFISPPFPLFLFSASHPFGKSCWFKLAGCCRKPPPPNPH